MHNNQLLQQPNQHQLSEGLEAEDLKRLVNTRVTIDEYKSKVGSDEEIVVVSFMVQGKDPALDLVSFVEKSYDWVIDADASSGELEDGSYVVFIEMDRNQEIPANLAQLFADLEPLTDLSIEDWSVVYAKPEREGTADQESLASIIPLSPEAYRGLQQQEKTELDQLKTAAGIKVETRAPKNDFTESLRIAAGIR